MNGFSKKGGHVMMGNVCVSYYGNAMITEFNQDLRLALAKANEKYILTSGFCSDNGYGKCNNNENTDIGIEVAFCTQKSI
tara:strand:- start:90 stop:329 length:240 start_codon:yes stop_codon:yes gene_type:complete